MSFSFAFTGTRKGVLRELSKVQGYGDQSQFNAARDFCINEVTALPDEYPHLIAVSANGHHDANNRNVQIKVEPNYTKLALDEESE